MEDELYPTFDIDEDEEEDLEEDEPEYRIEPKFDFEKGDFIMDDTGGLVMADGVATWIQWCNTVVATEREAFAAYSEDIGVELEEWIGENNQEAMEEELTETITEALLYDPAGRTEEVEDVTFSWNGNSVYVTAYVTSKDGVEAEISLDYKLT